jgi:hypothetical protein
MWSIVSITFNSFCAELKRNSDKEQYDEKVNVVVNPDYFKAPMKEEDELRLAVEAEMQAVQKTCDDYEKFEQDLDHFKRSDRCWKLSINERAQDFLLGMSDYFKGVRTPDGRIVQPPLSYVYTRLAQPLVVGSHVREMPVEERQKYLSLAATLRKSEIEEEVKKRLQEARKKRMACQQKRKLKK